MLLAQLLCDWWLEASADGPGVVERGLAASHAVQEEDTALCHAVQGGLASRCVSHRTAPGRFPSLLMMVLLGRWRTPGAGHAHECSSLVHRMAQCRALAPDPLCLQVRCAGVLDMCAWHCAVQE